jgi:monoterpene epsilon-lactone hydrolase
MRMLRLLFVSLLETLVSRISHGRLRPSWGFQFEWVVRFLRRDSIELSRLPAPALRSDLDGRRYPSKAVPRVRIESQVLGGVPVVTVTPPNVRRGAVLLYFHGGSYMFGSARTTHADLLARLALGTDLVIVAPDYRLAPEHPYPAALEDALRVYDVLRAADAESRIIVSGDSAGGNLALSLQLALRDAGRPQADAAILISPWLDLTASRPSCRANDRFDFGQTSFLLPQARAFAGDRTLDDPRISPINAELSGLLPVFVQIGGAERLHDEALEFVEMAEKAGVDVAIDVAGELPHLPPVFADFHPDASAALARLIDQIFRFARPSKEG